MASQRSGSLLRARIPPLLLFRTVRAERRKSHRTASNTIALILPLLTLASCGGGSGDSGSTNAPGTTGSNSPPASQGQDVEDGRYVGTVTIDGVSYFGDAIIVGGETHLYIGSPYTDDGTIQLASPEGSIDVVSPAMTPTGHSVSGAVIGRDTEDCGAGAPSLRWCYRAASAHIDLEPAASAEADVIHGEVSGHDETWTLDLASWSNAYAIPARVSDLAGQYDEKVAPFGANGMVMTIDETGRAFFQAGSLCTGNGTFTPHGDGNANVFDVEMSIDNCDYPYSSYNGSYRGLATLSPSSYWGYDTHLRTWLMRSRPGWAAVTLWGERL